jgi:hypothetical protein
MPGEPSRRRSGRSHEALGDERPRGMAIPAAGCAEAGQNPAYKPSGTIAKYQNITGTLLLITAIIASIVCTLWSPSRRRLHDVPRFHPCDISKICSFI